MSDASYVTISNDYPQSLEIAMLCASLIGIFGNALIIIATWQTKSLHHRCNVLIAIMAFVDLLASVYFVQVRANILAGGFFWTNRKCFLWSIYGLLSINMQSGLGLALGVDRLLAIVQPIRYQVWGSKKYLFLMLLPVFAYAVAVVGYGYSQSSTNVTVPVCSPTYVYGPKARSAFLFSNLVIIVFIVLIYGTAQYKIRSKKNVSLGSEERVATTKHLLNSLSYVMVVFSTSWALVFVAILLLQVWSPETPIGSVIAQQNAWLVIIFASSNVVFYAWRSEEYRSAFLKTLTFGQYYYKNGIKRKNVVSVLAY